MENIGALKIELHETEERLLTELRTLRRGLRGTQDGSQASRPRLTIGQRVADAVAATMGSWTFIIIQSFLLVVWIALNVTAYVQQWDPYPFILLNLALSFQAAYAAPFIMMSQNRQQDIDRKSAEDDFKINIKAELTLDQFNDTKNEYLIYVCVEDYIRLRGAMPIPMQIFQMWFVALHADLANARTSHRRG